jgi:hypothetical protein
MSPCNTMLMPILTLRRFLWVKYQLDLIFALASKEDIQEALRSLHKNMTSTYARILDKSKSQDSKKMVDIPSSTGVNLGDHGNAAA